MAISLPDTSVLFAFNRYTMKVTDDDPNGKASISVYCGSKSYIDSRTTDSDGACDIVFNHYLQLCFDKEEIIKGNISVDVSIEAESPRIGMARQYTVYWGAISAGERLGDRTLRWYPSLNNPLPCWIIGGTTTMLQVDNDAVIRRGEAQMNDLYDMRNFIEYVGGMDGRHELVVMQVMEGNNQTTFDETFDYTFWAFGKDDVLRTKMLVDCGTSGIYLKWIDPQGCWYYWLFEPSTKTYKTKAIGDDYETFTEGENVGYYGAVRPQGYTQENTQTVACPVATKEERRVLETILASPLVFWCPDVEKIASGDLTNDTAEWLPVRIVAGSTKDDLTNLSDFEIDVQYPNKNVQTL